MGLDVGHHVELLAERVRLVDAELQVLVIEFVVANPQAVAGLARIDGVCAIGIGVTHILEGAGGGEQFWSEHVGLFLSDCKSGRRHLMASYRLMALRDRTRRTATQSGYTLSTKWLDTADIRGARLYSSQAHHAI
ncbi:hypothetical protein D3C84_521410 [compost metagenome]